MAGQSVPAMMRLFGVDIAAYQPAVYNFKPLGSSSLATASSSSSPAIASSAGGLFLHQGRPPQDSDGKGAEVSRAAVNVDTSLGLSNGSSRRGKSRSVVAKKMNVIGSMTCPELSLSLGGFSPKMAFQESDSKGFKISASSSGPALSGITDEDGGKSDVAADEKGSGVAGSWMADSAPVYSTTPFRCFPPTTNLSLGGRSLFFPRMIKPFGEFDGMAVNVSATDQASVLSPVTVKKQKRKQRDVTDEKKGKSAKRVRLSNPVDDQELETVPSLEEIPGILQKIESNNGTRPEFLYRKRLQVSDVKPDQNRLFLTKCARVLEFLTEEERSVVAESRAGLELSAVDPLGQSYKLHLATWPSLNMVVLNTDWRKLAHGNNAKEGYFVELWGYRQNGKLCFAANFRKPEAAETQTNAGSSGSTNGGTVTA